MGGGEVYTDKVILKFENWSKNTKVMDFDLTWVRQESQSMVSLEAKTITLVFFDQFSIKKGLDGGF